MEVNKSVLAACSSYFRSLWFLEFGDKNENPIDFSHLPVTSDTFFSFIRSFYGKSFTLNESNVYHLYYLLHYFQVDKLIDQFENHLNTHLVTWAWLKPFIKEADEGNDLRALDFVGPFFSKIDDLLIDDVMAITTEGFKVLSQYCTSAQSLSWFVKSMVNSILKGNFDLDQFLNILNSCSVEVLSLQQWNEFLFIPLKHLTELEADLIKFSFSKVKDRCIDSLSKGNSELVSDIDNLKCEIEKLRQIATQVQSKVISFSQTKKHSQLSVSNDNKRVVLASGDPKYRYILGENPLLPGNDYTWKMWYQGCHSDLCIGVIDEAEFNIDGDCYESAHCCFSCEDKGFGCLSGFKIQWKPGELLEINANLIDFTLTVKSVGNSSTYLTGTLPRLSSGNYYPFACLYYVNHVLEIVE
ncbi:hypothetical protein GEMRC1_004356 [Eukaryota sp. GEM-RC1]